MYNSTPMKNITRWVKVKLCKAIEVMSSKDVRIARKSRESNYISPVLDDHCCVCSFFLSCFLSLYDTWLKML